MKGFPTTSHVAFRDASQLFPHALRIADKTITKKLEDIPPPKLKRKGDVIVYRFPNKDLDTYLLLKIVQLASNLRAGKVLIDKGFTYEWTMLHRTIDESTKHVLVLLSANRKNQWQEFHENVLTTFFEEDISQKGKIIAPPPKHIPPEPIRSELQDLIEESGSIPDEFLGKAAPSFKAMQKIKSGFVHGRATSIMSLYDPETNRFLTSGNCPEKAIQLRNLWRATHGAIGGCVAQSALKLFDQDYFRFVAQFADQFANAAKVGVTFDRRTLSRLA